MQGLVSLKGSWRLSFRKKWRGRLHVMTACWINCPSQEFLILNGGRGIKVSVPAGLCPNKHFAQCSCEVLTQKHLKMVQLGSRN